MLDSGPNVTKLGKTYGKCQKISCYQLYLISWTPQILSWQIFGSWGRESTGKPPEIRRKLVKSVKMLNQGQCGARSAQILMCLSSDMDFSC